MPGNPGGPSAVVHCRLPIVVMPSASPGTGFGRRKGTRGGGLGAGAHGPEVLAWVPGRLHGVATAGAQVFPWGLSESVVCPVTSGKLLPLSLPLFPALQSGSSLYSRLPQRLGVTKLGGFQVLPRT